MTTAISRHDDPLSDTERLGRQAKNAAADEKFKALIGERLFNIMATNDGGKLHMRRPDTIISGGSSMAYAASGERG